MKGFLTQFLALAAFIAIAMFLLTTCETTDSQPQETLPRGFAADGFGTTVPTYPPVENQPAATQPIQQSQQSSGGNTITINGVYFEPQYIPPGPFINGSQWLMVYPTSGIVGTGYFIEVGVQNPRILAGNCQNFPMEPPFGLVLTLQDGILIPPVKEPPYQTFGVIGEIRNPATGQVAVFTATPNIAQTLTQAAGAAVTAQPFTTPLVTSPAQGFVPSEGTPTPIVVTATNPGLRIPTILRLTAIVLVLGIIGWIYFAIRNNTSGRRSEEEKI